jgi:SNF2 family DNA or RNA helicase
MNEFKDKYHITEPEGLKELNAKTDPFILRRLKSQVCRELPPKTEIILFCEFNEDQRLFYEQAISAGKDEISEKRLKEKTMSIHILTFLLRLRQIACHPALVLADKQDLTLTSGKHDLVLSTAQEILAEGHKILIFSQFTEHLKLLRHTFNSQELASFYLDGSTINRQGVIEDFQGYDSPCVFFMSLKAGGLGLNLTEASYVFLLDPWWNPAVENQAIDRCYRIGQDDPVTVYRFITKDSIEEKVSQLQEIKKVMEKRVISEADIDHVPLTEERLERLLESI